MFPYMSRYAWQSLALFGAGVFFHGSVDHALIALTGTAPDIGDFSGGGSRWALAIFDVLIAFILYEVYRHRQKGASE